jgi:tetratricopeptide (TPR) repeat protein
VLLFLCLLAHPGAPHELREIDAELKLHPDRADLYLDRAEFLRTIARYDDALLDLEIAAALGADIDSLRARIHEMRGEDRLAEYYASQALLLDPEAHVHFLRGRVRERIGDLEGALADYRAALELGTSVELHLAEGRVLISMKRIEEARRALSRGIDATGSVVLQRELIRVAEPHVALEQLQAILQRAQVKTEWLLLRAGVLEKLGHTKEAVQDRERAVGEAERLARKRPAPAVLLSRAKAYEAVGRTAEAARDRREAEARWRR